MQTVFQSSKTLTRLNIAAAVDLRFSQVYWHPETSSRACRHSALTSLANSRSMAQCPPVQALRDALHLPSGVRGPLDCSHGFQVRICADCLARRSELQCVAMLMLQ